MPKRNLKLLLVANVVAVNMIAFTTLALLAHSNAVINVLLPLLWIISLIVADGG